MNKKSLLSAATAAVLLASAARAQTALQQLAAQSGVDAAPLAATQNAARLESSRSTEGSEIPARDVFAGCPALGDSAVIPANAKQAAIFLQTCLNHVYPQSGAYQVQAQAARFGVRACPPGGAASCGAIIEVDGIELSVSGTVPDGDPVLFDLGYSLSRRSGRLLGFPAIVAR
ncbi:MAG: hypothetical protein HKL90_09415 [Elusimicrobia bacterium]|nr:hypothetical protein [Elusimicrobiota bacterium]